MSFQNSVLQQKLDEFIKKYYLNRLLQGGLLVLGGLVAFFTLAAVLEYFGHFGSTFRAFLFYSFIIFAFTIIGLYVIIPLLKLFKIGKTLNYKQASTLVGSHFPEIKDKLLNTLQLQEQNNASHNELLMASINQRIQNLSPFTFSKAINLKDSIKKYSRYALLPLLMMGIILVFQSNILTNPVNRIISYNEQFAKEAPFEYILKNTSLNILRNSDCKIELETKGKNLPAEVFINIDKHLIKMEKDGKNTFSYQFQNLTANHSFFFSDGEFTSNTYELKVLPNPVIANFKVNITYPAYIGRKPEAIQNTGDLTVPKGTKIEWVFNTKDAEKMNFMFDNKLLSAQKNDNAFLIQQTVLKNTQYFIQLANQFITQKDTIKYSIQSIEDRYPGIIAEQKPDSINPFIYYFYGKADDDYGISKLQFVYKNMTQNSLHQYLPVTIGRSTDEIFYYMVDLKTLAKNDGDELEYYFEVWDNDAVNGKKSSKSATFKSVSPSKEELNAQAESSSSSIKQKLNEAIKESMSLQKRSQELNKELLENNLEWQQEQKVKDFINDQKKLENKIEQLKTENKAKNEREKQLNPQDEELLKKQKEVEKLFNELLTPEMKAMMKKLEEMMKQQNKEAMQQELEKMKMKNEDMQKQLDRTLEQFKQMEMEKKIEEQINELNELAKEQEELAEKTEKKEENNEKLKEEQAEIDKKFEEIEKELNDLEKKNEELENKLDLEDTKKEQEDINKDLDDSKEGLEKKKNGKASESQKKAAEKMKKMAEKMKKAQEEGKEKQAEEDYYTLRQILENLIELSDEQEVLIKQMQETRNYNPKYVELSAKQRKLKEETKSVEDSLLALSKRQIAIQSFVNKEMSGINNNMDKAIESFGKIEINQGTVRQQYVMTGFNNLAVMLTESLKQMQEEMNEKKDKKPGEGQCKNPGGKKPGKPGKKGKPKSGSIGDMQKELGKKLQEMQNGQKSGKKPTSEEFAKIAAQQEALRRELGRLQQMLKEEGKEGALGNLKKTQDLMEQQERDLVNKQITPETMKRIQDIETRMLEHEKAEKEQEQDNKREAEQAKETNNSIPPAIKEYLEKKAREMELLRSLPPELSPYYKDKVRDYYKKVGNV